MLPRKQIDQIARRLKALRNTVNFEQRTGDIKDNEVQTSLNQVWDVLNNIQDRMIKPAKRRIVRSSKTPPMGKITGETGTMRIKEKGDGYGTNAIEIMGSDNWKTLSAKLPQVGDLTNPADWKSPVPSEGLETGELTSEQLTHFNAQFDRIASLESQLESMTNNLNTLLGRLDNKDLFDLTDTEKEVDLNINVGKSIGQ